MSIQRQKEEYSNAEQMNAGILQSLLHSLNNNHVREITTYKKDIQQIKYKHSKKMFYERQLIESKDCRISNLNKHSKNL